MNRRVLRTLACASALGVLSAIQVGSASADTATAETPTAAQLAPLNQSEIALLDSGSAINVEMDPSTGDILSVSAAAGVLTITPSISNRSVCDSGDGCYETNKTPYADEGFYGSAGTYDGTWDYRSEYTSGDYTVSACWSSGCGAKIGPGSSVSFTSDVTGTSFTIY